MTIAAILQSKGSEVLTVECDTTVREAVALLAERKIGALPVLRGGNVAGIMSERDVIYCLRSDGAAVLDWTVERIMTAPAITVDAGDRDHERAVADDPAPHPPSAGGRGRGADRPRLDRRPRQVPDGQDRGRRPPRC